MSGPAMALADERKTSAAGFLDQEPMPNEINDRLGNDS
jgi:hypothetical protein